MYDRKWMGELAQKAKEDPWYQTWLAEVAEREPAFLSIRSSLTPKQQEKMDDYISACEELEHARTLLAYLLGKEHATKIEI